MIIECVQHPLVASELFFVLCDMIQLLYIICFVFCDFSIAL